MTWEPPSFIEIKMDAEINSYADDFAVTPDVTIETADASRITSPEYSHRSIT